MAKHLFGTDGVRGIPGEYPLDDATICAIGRALGDYLRSTGRLDPVATGTLGRIVGNMAVLRAMSISVTRQICGGASPAVEAALVKDLGTELEQLIPIVIADALGAEPDVPLPGPLLRALAFVTQVAPSFSLRGGTREILRSMIARGLGLR